MQKTIFILSGPQGVGKTRHATTLAVFLDCENIVEEWNGRDALLPGTLAVTHVDYVMPYGTVAFCVADENGMNALVTALQLLAS